MPMTTEKSLNSNVSGRSVRPSASRVWLTGPFRSSSSIHEKVRTSSETQNGNRTP